MVNVCDITILMVSGNSAYDWGYEMTQKKAQKCQGTTVRLVFCMQSISDSSILLKCFNYLFFLFCFLY